MVPVFYLTKGTRIIAQSRRCTCPQATNSVYATTHVSNVTEFDLSAPFNERIDYYTNRATDQLHKALPPESQVPERLHEAMRYAVLNGGKRVRPLLVYATGECLDVPEFRLDAAATAIELIHAFSLVHDDLPAMDNDDLRRGKPTVHKQYDEATAILAADALQPLAFSVLANIADVSPDTKLRLIRLVAAASGSIGMTGGQSIDLAAEGCSLSASSIEHMYSLKTGALIEASIISAAILGEVSADQDKALALFAHRIGIAFQIKDDILDVEGETEIIGKPAGSDERLGKATFPGLFGVAAARTKCTELFEDALQTIEVFGSDAEPLRWLARYIVERGN